VDGGPATLSPQEQNVLLDMGWGAPDLGPSDFPNFRARWAPVKPPAKSGAFMSKEEAKEAARFAIETLRGPSWDASRQ
jgi:hypothetical protein